MKKNTLWLKGMHKAMERERNCGQLRSACGDEGPMQMEIIPLPKEGKSICKKETFVQWIQN
jgi:hypothetical protein